jgi:hypothetical protein
LAVEANLIYESEGCKELTFASFFFRIVNMVCMINSSSSSLISIFIGLEIPDVWHLMVWMQPRESG